MFTVSIHYSKCHHHLSHVRSPPLCTHMARLFQQALLHMFASNVALQQVWLNLYPQSQSSRRNSRTNRSSREQIIHWKWGEWCPVWTRDTLFIVIYDLKSVCFQCYLQMKIIVIDIKDLSVDSQLCYNNSRSVYVHVQKWSQEAFL